MSWKRYKGTARADAALHGSALLAELEAYVRVQNPHLTDVRLDEASANEGAPVEQGRRMYDVTYLADDGEGS
ncbi:MULTISPECIES: hypothetical protein [Mycobacterium]|uniref:Uncharacterized protein n=1 Tax=Mycobacterium kiyosense TaxID=2871094 RepID=A0A9P3Q0X9_9MYCO|nr:MULTISPECIES: hypothetical protein [Mycobacterium]BDB41023.1 hypothetical protein IWGMT90018_14690 [Mycobacterium kiyosense]BDE12821.1 hypothetical protein MKCMC460_16810 [Mycobacterium sp. 20KCMC460]GLB82495.1 hypothetical protein SRL2020028_17510 [Mycobacterium kiyosense]GLB90300.1 hypothetical protein SRL2020130_31170 [Mycobacterium kiyosense]GLB93903.1 hypothetical protein SRL2020226_06790 [Mycobacterium kiyosense]